MFNSLLAYLAVSVLATTCSAQVESSVSEPLEWSSVASAEQGVLAEVSVRVGQVVRRGDILALLDSQDLQQAILLAQMKADSKAAIAAAEAVLKLRKSQHDNLIGLSKDGHSNPLEIAQSTAQYEQAQAELMLAQEQRQQNLQEVQRLRALLERRTVRSPIDGVVTEVHRRVGEYVSANQPQVATVYNLDQLRVRFYLLPEQVDQLQLQQPINVLLTTSEVPSKIEFISPVTDPKTGLSRVDVLINNLSLNAKLRSGTICRWPHQIIDHVSRPHQVLQGLNRSQQQPRPADSTSQAIQRTQR
jgi:RND family efflux transporter MFP subunit